MTSVGPRLIGSHSPPENVLNIIVNDCVDIKTSIICTVLYLFFLRSLKEIKTSLKASNIIIGYRYYLMYKSAWFGPHSGQARDSCPGACCF